MTAALNETALRSREFEQIVDDIQPYYCQIADEQLKTRISLWIKKFHEKSLDSNETKTRNLYASLLLSMLRTNHVREPFLENPPSGPLMQLPDYYPSINEGPALPQWLDDGYVNGMRDDLQSVNSSLYSTVNLDSHFQQTPRADIAPSVSSVTLSLPKVVKRSPQKQQPISRNSIQRPTNRHSFTAINQPTQINGATSKTLDAWGDVEASQHSTITLSPAKVLAYVNGHQECSVNGEFDTDGPSENTKLHVREAFSADVRTRLEAKHDHEIKRVLDKKNSEAEELRAYYRSKLTALESERDRLKDRLTASVSEVEEVKRDKRSEVDSIRKVMMEAIDSKQAECDRAIEQAVSQAAAERNVMQRQQAAAIQQLLDDTQSRLQRVESDYREQYSTAAQMVQRLEQSVRELSTANTELTNQRDEGEQKLTKLQFQMADNEEQLDSIRKKFSELQDNHYGAVKRYEEQLHDLQNKAAETEDLLRQELEKTIDRHESEKRAAESAIDDLRAALNETKIIHQREVDEIEKRRQYDLKNLQNQFELKMAELAQATDLERNIAERKISQLELEIHERDTELVAVVDRCRTEAAKSERQIEEFRAHIEETTLKALSDSRTQFAEVEKELDRAKRELLQITNERDQLKSASEQIRKEHEQQIEDLVRAHSAELAIIRESGVHEREMAVKELRSDLERRIRDIASRAQKAEEDVKAAENDWKAKTARLIEQAADEARHEQREIWEKQRKQLVEEHEKHVATATERWEAERSKFIAQLDDRLVAENAARELRDNELQSLRNELTQTRETTLREKGETERRWSSEVQRLQAELNAAQVERDAIQHELRVVKVQHEQRLREVTWSAESRIGEMLPANVRNDLEATIEALRSQVRHHEQTNEALRARLALRLNSTTQSAVLHSSGSGGSVSSDTHPGTSGLGSEHGDTLCGHA